MSALPFQHVYEPGLSGERRDAAGCQRGLRSFIYLRFQKSDDQDDTKPNNTKTL